MPPTLEDLEVREGILMIRGDALPAIQRAYRTANSYDLRKVRDPKQRAKLSRIRELTKALEKELR